MGIVDEDVAAVRAASDIVAVVSQYVQLRKVGRQWMGLCPFHSERTPSFSVNGEQGVYFCHGCQARGDVITFVREIEHLDFAPAVELLAAKAGVAVTYSDRSEGEGRKRRTRLVEIMVKAVGWYHDRLLSGADAGPARRFLRQRGLDGQVVRDFQIGWAPDAWDALCSALSLDPETARDTGLGFLNSRQRLQDGLRGRVMFPIFDAEGNPVGFGGRNLPGADNSRDPAKYKNTPETRLYQKSKVLYGLNWAKSAIVTAGTGVICEGYTDVIGFHRSGVPLAVATCGTSLTDDHVKLLRRFTRRLVLAFDADAAGQSAAERFYRWEAEHDLEVMVADLPPGMDPADVAQSDPPRLAAAIENATPFLRFRLERVFAAADLATNEGRARAASAALALVAEHPDELVRDQYLMEVASRGRIEPDQLRSQLDRHRRDLLGSGGRRSRGRGGGGPGPRSPGGAPGDGFGGPTLGTSSAATEERGSAARSEAADGVRQRAGRRSPDGPALEVLRHAVHDPEAVGRWLDERLFTDPVHAGVYTALVTADTHAEALDSAVAPVADLLARLLVEQPTSHAFDAVRRLLTETARAQVRALRLAAATADDPAKSLSDVTFLDRCIEDLRDPSAGAEAAERLLAWLGQPGGDGE